MTTCQNYNVNVLLTFYHLILLFNYVKNHPISQSNHNIHQATIFPTYTNFQCTVIRMKGVTNI